MPAGHSTTISILWIDGEAAAVGGDSVDGDAAVDGRQETSTERADRNFNELLQELRVAQTGVQILFAFLLTLPFTDGFAKITAQERGVYLGTLIATALATSCLIAPVSHHRILFRRRRKPELVNVASRLALAGLAFLLISVVGSVYLIFDVVVGTGVAGVIAGAIGLWLLLVWYVYPLAQRRTRHKPAVGHVGGGSHP
jgi:membrane associated rhomboid family serine protease